MKVKEEFKPTPLSILIFACVIFAPFSFLINFICGISITPTTLLQLWASILIFAIMFLISLIVTFVKKINYRKRAINYFACAYTSISFVLNTFAAIVEGTSVWSIYSLLLVAGYSILISVLFTFIKIKNYLLSTFVYYILSITAFLILTIVIAECNEGYQIMLSFGIFSVSFAISSVIYFYVKRSIAQIENEEKTYKPLFD